MKKSTRRRYTATSLLTVAIIGLVAAATALAAVPRTTSPPTLSGTFRQDSTLKTSDGLWANTPTSFTYVWQRCDANGTACANITGATNNTYKLVVADVGRTVRTLVTAKNADGSDTANSKPSPVIADNTTPKNTALPTISGSAVAGEELTADPGAFTGAPDRYTYRWNRCDTAGSACVSTSSTGKVYGVRTADVGKTLRVEVTAINSKGRSTAVSNATEVVRASGSPPPSGNAVAVANVSLPDRLVASTAIFSPTSIGSRNDLVTLSVRVNDTRGRLVQGALVYATGVPFGIITAMPEAATGSNGIATLQFRPTVRLTLRRGYAVQIFLRVRKPGDNVLAGVSSRRLVQVRIVPG